MSDWITRTVEQLGYAGVALMMFLENLFPPLPSELIMPLASYVAAKGELSLAGVLAAGTAGTVAGALFRYGVARWVGGRRLRRWAGRHGRWITLTPDDLHHIDRWFDRHRWIAVPVGRLIPGIRTFVSIPAGVFGMGLPGFLALTTVGAGAWTGPLGLTGWWLGTRYAEVDRWLGPVGAAVLTLIAIGYVYRVATFGRGQAPPL